MKTVFSRHFVQQRRSSRENKGKVYCTLSTELQVNFGIQNQKVKYGISINHLVFCTKV